MKLIKISLISLNLLMINACTNANTYMDKQEYKLAVQGNVDAQYNTAMNFMNGDEGYPLDLNEAHKWFEKASLQGDSSAQNALGIIYLRGLGVDRDLDKAETYYRKAALQGHSNSQLQLALLLLKKNNRLLNTQIHYLLQQSAAQGNKEAKAKLDEINSEIK